MAIYGPDYAAAYREHWRRWGAGEWAPFLIDLAGVDGGAWLDVACGTGELAAVVAKRGFEVTGLDISSHQLDHARDKAPAARFVRGDVRTFEVGRRRFDAVTCVGGSVGYLATKRDLERALRRMAGHLKTAGVMLFDVNLPAAFEANAGRTIVLPDAERPTFITVRWDGAKRRARWEVTGFVKAGRWWRRFTEAHDLRAWRREEIDPLLDRIGLGCERYDLDTLDEADDQTARMLYRCQRSGG